MMGSMDAYEESEAAALTVTMELDTEGAAALQDLMALRPRTDRGVLMSRAMAVYVAVLRAQRRGGGAWMQSSRESPPIKEHFE